MTCWRFALTTAKSLTRRWCLATSRTGRGVKGCGGVEGLRSALGGVWRGVEGCEGVLERLGRHVKGCSGVGEESEDCGRVEEGCEGVWRG